MNDEINLNRCPKCQAPLPVDAPQGLCAKCLLAAAALPTETDQPPEFRSTLPSLATIATAFPQLEILALIGQGGMGAVYKARQAKLDRFVALKLLTPSLAGKAAFAERFNREARVLARLNYPGIVSVYDYGESSGFFYLLMEYVDGLNLRQAMQAGKFTPAQALVLVPKICEALQFAHDEGILHRDIKPENILLDTRGRVKIADFGIAKLVGDVTKEVTLTASGLAVGTPHYMAPEQLEHPQDVDQRADIYSLGVVFYEMLTGELPIGRFAPPSRKTPVDSRVDEVVLRALEKERELRQRNATEIKTAVEQIAANPAVPVESIQQPLGSRQAGPSGTEVNKPVRPWSRMALWSAGLVVFSLIPAALFLFLLMAIVFQWGGVAGIELIATLTTMLATGLPGTLLGAMANHRIRQSGNRLQGRELSLFASLCWPLLLLDALLTTLMNYVVETCHWAWTPASWVLAAVLATLILAAAGALFAVSYQRRTAKS